MTWILILLMNFSGFVKGVKIEPINGFQSEAACLKAAQLVVENSTKKVIGICVATEIISET